jgi:Fic family protein
MKYLDNNLIKIIEEKMEELNKLRPLPISAVKKLKEQFQIQMTYNSNAIEGNSLTLKETFLVINEGLTIKGKPLKDHLEAKNHQEALEYLYQLIEKEKKNTISEIFIRNIHQIVMKDDDKEWAGKYRNSNVMIAGADHTPPDSFEVPFKMKEIIDWLNENKKKMNIIELSAIFHHKLTYIHPFFDGNGRTARLIMNVLLMEKGFPLVIILKNDRKKYYQVLQKADKGNYKPLVLFVAQSVLRSLNIYLENLIPFKKNRFLPLSEISKKTKYSAKYLNYLSRKGKIDSFKKGRIWYTNKQAIDKYIKSRKRKKK